MRYPTTKAGLAVPVQELGYDVVPFKRRETNRHHLQFERRDYLDTTLHRVFRGLANRVVDMRLTDHADLHERYSAPRMPKDFVMIETIDEYLNNFGVIDVVREKRTHEIYQLSTDQWETIRSGNGLQETYQRATRLTYS